MILINLFIVKIEELDVFRILSGVKKMKKLIKVNLILFYGWKVDDMKKLKNGLEEISLMIFEEEMAFHMIMASGLFN